MGNGSLPVCADRLLAGEYFVGTVVCEGDLLRPVRLPERVEKLSVGGVIGDGRRRPFQLVLDDGAERQLCRQFYERGVPGERVAPLRDRDPPAGVSHGLGVSQSECHPLESRHVAHDVDGVADEADRGLYRATARWHYPGSTVPESTSAA